MARTLEIDRGEGRAWIEESLGGGKSLTGGFEVSAAVLAAEPFDRGCFSAFVPEGMAREQIKFPHFPDVHGSEAALATYLDGLASKGASCLVIEDELALRADPGLDKWSVPSAFIGDRVVHWLDLEPGCGATAFDAINESSGGYPLNSFVVTKSAADLRLLNGRPAADDLAGQVASSLMAIVVSAFDATSFAMWTADCE
jgi:hypothetical protein